MATSRIVGIGDAAGMIRYCLSARGKAKKEPKGERVEAVYSSLLAGGDDLQGMLSELRLNAGRKFEAYHLRVSFSPSERINPEVFPAFCSALQERVLGGRQGLFVLHGDSNCQHIHVVSSFKDSAGRIINNKGKGKWTACAALQHSVDEVCRGFDLSTLSIPEGDIYRSSENSPMQGKVRRSLAEIRMKENSRESFVSSIRSAIARGVKVSKDFSDLEKHLSQAGITFYERGASLVFQDSEGRKVRLSKMYAGMRSKQDLESFISNSPEGAQRKEKKDMLEFVLNEEQRGAARERAAREGAEKERAKRAKAEETARKIAEKIMNGSSPYEAAREVQREEREKEYEAKKRARDEEYKEQKEQREREYEKKQAERKSEIEADRAKQEIQRAVSGLGIPEVNAIMEGNFLPAAIALSKALGAAGVIVSQKLRPRPGEGMSFDQAKEFGKEIFNPKAEQDNQDKEPDDDYSSFGPGR